ncbi:glycosyltransferase family 4 protein [Herbaspirillum sp. alder98]|uniref:glycosyltransferase family 4 protein n=1 Tax=Herbaspirillum sp. alder98 TaxID=2913096 RepID=UPI001CD83245|nr:glycosyltransferase family 1 protein [Herbaspirillum sp. alder98]MCA1324318.1 glycosyltransferase family 4 protein [Herbaspirillum sp. alder98]
MKIVINALSARIGGGQTYLRQLLSRIPDVPDLQILIFASDSLDINDHPNIKLLKTNFPTENPLMRTFWEKYILPRRLREINPDVFFCPGGVVATKAPPGCRVVTMFRNMVPFDEVVKKQMPYGLQRIRVNLLEGVMLRSMAGADLVIFISEFARQVIESRITVKKAMTIPHGISAHFRQHDAAVSVAHIVPAKPYILYVSRFESYKHHQEVVEAYLKLPAAIQAAYDLVLVGENDNPFGDVVRNLIKNKAATHKVHMLGGVKYSTLPNVYRQAQLIVFASSCENCPNILLEALSAGRPIICSSVMPMPEFGGDAVAYFNPVDSDDISQKMALLLSNPQLADQYAERATVQGLKYNWDITARDTWTAILAL